MQTSVDIPKEVASELFRRAPGPGDRSALVTRILRDYFKAHPHTAQEERDLIDNNADELNREATEVLDYQVIP